MLALKLKGIGTIAVWLVFATGSFCQSPADSLVARINASSGVARAEAYYQLIYATLRKDPAAARTYIQEFRDLIAREKEEALLGYNHLFEGSYFSAIGQQDTSAAELERAKEAAIESRNKALLIKAESSLGKTYISMGKAEKGLENLFAALSVLTEFPELETELKVRINIMWAYLELKRYHDCIRFGRASLLYVTPPFQWTAPFLYNNLAVAYGAVDRPDSALYYVNQSIPLAEEVADYNTLANAYFIRGNIYSDQGDYQNAIAQFEKAKPYRAKIGNVFFMVADQYTLSNLYAQAGDFKKGIEAGLEGLRLAEKNKLTMKFEGVYESLAKNYEGLGDFKSASKYHRLWAIAKDSIYKTATTEAIAEMQTKYESEKKEQQIVLQNLQLAEQQAQLKSTYLLLAALGITTVLLLIIFLQARNRFKRKQQLLIKENELVVRDAFIQATLQSQEMERKRFAQDLHDSMGQLISALRLVLSSTSKEAPLETRLEMVAKSERILDEMHKEIRSVAFNLMPQTLIQQGLLPALQEMGNRINQTGRLAVTARGFDLPERLTELQEISLFRVLQEWTNNVLKHSTASQVSIQIIRHDEELVVTAEDNGDGFNASILENGKGNGWRNIQSRLKAIKASCDLDSVAGRSGNTLIIHVPLNTGALQPRYSAPSMLPNG